MGEFIITSGFTSVFHSGSKQPLAKWGRRIRSGTIKKVKDDEQCCQVLEICSPKMASTYITCPSNPTHILGIKNPILNMTVKNLNKFFAFDVQIQDDKGVKRRFRASTHQSVPEIKPYFSRIPLILEDGWNQITFPLQEFSMRSFGTNHVETLRIQIYANCRLRRIFFSNKVCQEQELPIDIRLYQMFYPKRAIQKNTKEIWYR